MEKTKLAPSLRFKGFTETYEQCKLSNLCSMNARIGWQNLRTSEFLDQGDYYLITGTDFEDGRINLKTCHYINKVRFDQDPKIQVQNGNILITKDGTLGKVAYVDKLDKPATLNAGVFNVRVTNKNADGLYLFHYLKAPFLMKYAEEKSTGGTIKHLNQNILVDFPVNIPEFNEQVKIGSVLEGIDNLITLHQRKYDKLTHMKAALLEKMFPQKGENTPRVRFKGFADTWEQYKLSQLYDFSKGRGLSLDSFYEGNDSLGIAYGHLYTKYTEVINKVTLSTYDESGVLSRKGDLLFPGSSTVPFGTAQSNAIMLDNVKLGGDVIIARARNLDIYAPFISYQINAQKSKLFPITVGTTITHMYGKDIANIEYKFPKYDEQVKIGRTLESLDSLITLHQRKLEKLKNLKNACLEKMFV